MHVNEMLFTTVKNIAKKIKYEARQVVAEVNSFTTAR